MRAHKSDPIRVFVHHPHDLTLIGLRGAFEGDPRLTVVGAGGSRRSLARHARDSRTDVIVLGLPDAERPAEYVTRATPVVVLSDNHTPDTVRAAVRAGARAFLSLDAPPDDLRHAVRTVAAGGAVLCRCAADALLDAAEPAGTGSTAGHPEGPLSRREREVLGLLAAGLGSAEIAEQLTVTEATVRSHIHHLLGKLGLRGRAQAIAWAFQHGLVTTSAPTSLDSVRHSRRVEPDLRRHA